MFTIVYNINKIANRQTEETEMIKQWTPKQHAKHESNIIAQANIWLQKYNPEQVAMIIWNKYGYLSEAKNGVVWFKGCQGMVAVR